MVALLLALVAALHPIHTSVLELRWDQRSGALEGTLRIFADDLQAARTAAKATAGDYVLRNLGIVAGGRFVTLETCGEQNAADAVLICLRGVTRALDNLRVRNTVLMELHTDQVNIVRIEKPISSTLLLTRRTPEQKVSSQ